MIEFHVDGIKCLRTIYRTISQSEVDLLKEKYDYIYLATYNRIFDNDLSYLEKKTSVINLNGTIKRIHQTFNATTRNEINKTMRNESLSFVCNDKNVDEAYRIITEFEKAHGWNPTIRGEIEQSNIFAAYFQSKMVALISAFCNDGIMRITQISSVRIKDEELGFPKKYISYCTRRIIYEMCHYGLRNNFEYLDLGVINLIDPSKKGIAQFKRSFKGNIIDTYIYRYETEKFLSLQEKLKNNCLYIH